MTNINLFSICATLLCFLAIQSPTFAASFDCAKASKPREKLICDDQALSDLDSQLGHLYSERRSLLSPSGVELLQKSEQNWLRFAATVCPVDTVRPVPSNPTTFPSGPFPKACLQRQYEDRLKQLSMVGQKQGPFIFNRIDLFAAGPSADDNLATPGFWTEHVAYPQIDNITTPATESWNQRARRNLANGDDCENGHGDDDIDYVVGYASGTMISAQWSDYTYCHGTPHGFGGSKTENLVLEPSLHPFKPADLFASGSDWVAKLQSLFWDALSAQGWKPGNEGNKAEILGIVVAPDRWLFTDKGITVGFSSYEGGCYACTPQPVTVSWEDLKPLVSANFWPRN
jgi:uncharacterized protein